MCEPTGQPSGVQLNDRQARANTQLIVSASLSKLHRASVPESVPDERSRLPVCASFAVRHRSLSTSSASSSSSSSSQETAYNHTTRGKSYLLDASTEDYTVSTVVATRKKRTPRMRTRQLVADLSRELERVRREADRLLADRDEEVSD